MAETNTMKDFLNQVQNGDSPARYAALKVAAQYGPSSILPLADIMGGPDPTASRAAEECLKRIVHHEARPGNSRKPAVAALEQTLTNNRPRKVRSLGLHLLGFLGDRSSVKAIVPVLSEPDLRENARMALEQIPDPAAERALSDAMRTASAEFKPGLQQSIHHRHQNSRDIGLPG